MSSLSIVRKPVLLFSALTLLIAPSVMAQSLPANPFGLEVGQTPQVQFIGEYDFTRANAPPGGCGCFWMQGGGGQLEIAISPKLSLVADLHATRASNINGTNQEIGVFNDVFGARLSRRHFGRLTYYAHALVGTSEVFSNYPIYKSGLISLAVQGGGGVDYRLSRRYSFRAVEVNYINSRATNGVNDRQNNIRFSSGISMRFDMR